ncbi:MAG: hypothetical protein HY820_32445 [Acidobacteria bacterium]|nr:hypothetical protein [Acidobacteriota bacterium]
MTSIGTAPATALFYNLEETLSHELRSALGCATPEMAPANCRTLDECIEYARSTSPQVIFCPYSRQLISMLSSLDSTTPRIPVVVVTRHPEAREWIDSIEAGASDYCSAPFEPRQLRWIISANRQ